MIRKKQIRCRPYTLVEILVVLALLMILFGIGSASISALTGKRGLNGAVSVVSSQVNLARSVAVSNNRYVALLVPDPDSNLTTHNNTNFKSFFCNKMRLCFVKKQTSSSDYEFDGWIMGYEWVELPKRTCMNIITGSDNAAGTSPPVYQSQSILDIPVFTTGSNVKSTGIVFAPNGRLAESLNVMLHVYTAIPNSDTDGNPDMRDLGITDWINTQNGSHDYSKTKLGTSRWCVKINKFTGRTRISYGQPEDN